MKTLLAFSMVVGLSAVGCSNAARVSYTASEAHTVVPRPEAGVDVLLDQEPSRPFRVVGALKASSLESPRSIDMMRVEAAKAGLDGIYWIECSSPTSGHCSAKGFVYTTVVSGSDLDGVRVAAR